MHNNIGTLAKSCYQPSRLWMGQQPVVKAAGDLYVENLNHLLGHKRGVNAALAKHCGVDPSTVTRWRAGETDPSIEMMGKIAEFVKKPLSAFFIDGTDERSTQITLGTALKMVTEAVNKTDKNDA